MLLQQCSHISAVTLLQTETTVRTLEKHPSCKNKFNEVGTRFVKPTSFMCFWFPAVPLTETVYSNSNCLHKRWYFGIVTYWILWHPNLAQFSSVSCQAWFQQLDQRFSLGAETLTKTHYMTYLMTDFTDLSFLISVSCRFHIKHSATYLLLHLQSLKAAHVVQYVTRQRWPLSFCACTTVQAWVFMLFTLWIKYKFFSHYYHISTEMWWMWLREDNGNIEGGKERSYSSSTTCPALCLETQDNHFTWIGTFSNVRQIQMSYIFQMYETNRRYGVNPNLWEFSLNNLKSKHISALFSEHIVVNV